MDLAPPSVASIICFDASSDRELIVKDAPKSLAIFSLSLSISTTMGLIPYAALAIFNANNPKPPALTIISELSCG